LASVSSETRSHGSGTRVAPQGRPDFGEPSA